MTLSLENNCLNPLFLNFEEFSWVRRWVFEKKLRNCDFSRAFDGSFQNALFRKQKPQFHCFPNKRLRGWRQCVLGANYLQFGGGSSVISANSL